MADKDTRCAPTRRETRKQDRRQAIVDAARKSFLEAGYAATSMSGLLTTLGGSKATLWGYFRSKEDLFAAVVEDVSGAFRARLAERLHASADVSTTLTNLCVSFMERISEPDGIATWRLVVAESGRFPELGQIFYERAAQHAERVLSAYVVQQIAAGHLRDENAEDMARTILSFCTMRQNRRLWGVEPEGEQATIQADAARFADYFMRLFATTPHHPR